MGTGGLADTDQTESGLVVSFCHRTRRIVPGEAFRTTGLPRAQPPGPSLVPRDGHPEGPVTRVVFFLSFLRRPLWYSQGNVEVEDAALSLCCSLPSHTVLTRQLISAKSPTPLSHLRTGVSTKTQKSASSSAPRSSVVTFAGSVTLHLCHLTPYTPHIPTKLRLTSSAN